MDGSERWRWTATEIVGVLNKVGPVATKVLLLLLEEHNEGHRGSDPMYGCEGVVLSNLIFGKNEEIRVQAGIESEEGYESILRLLESEGYFVILWDPKGHDHVIKFNSPTEQEIRDARDASIEYAKRQLEVKKENEKKCAEERAARLRDRTNNPWKYCSSMKMDGEPCFSPSGTDGVCTNHRVALDQVRCTHIMNSGIRCRYRRKPRDPNGMCNFHARYVTRDPDLKPVAEIIK